MGAVVPVGRSVAGGMSALTLAAAAAAVAAAAVARSLTAFAHASHS